MAKMPKAEPSDDEDWERQREETARAREQFGIETLADDEELIDSSSFARMHHRLANLAEPDLSGASPPGTGQTVEAHVRSEDELLLEEIASELPPDPAESAGEIEVSRPLVPAPVSAADAARLEADLARAADRDQVARLALRIARRHAQAAALLVVNKGLIAGLRGAGGDLEKRVEGILVSCETESLFSLPVAHGKALRGPAPRLGIDGQLLRAMGRSEAHELAVLPIRIRDRVVNLLYVDNGPAPLGETNVAALTALCRCMAAAYERLILERKRR